MLERIATWVRQHLRTTVSAVAAGIVVGLVAVIALTSPGYSRQDVHVDDGSVWVANATDRLIGNANAEIGTLSSAIASSAGDVSLLQDTTHVVAHDRAGNTLALIDPAQAKLTETVPLPEGTPDVVSAGSDVAIYLPSTGDAWVTSFDDLRQFSAKSAPTFSLGVDATLAVDSVGHYAGYSMKSKRLVTGSLNTTTKSPTESRTVAFPGKLRDVRATIVDGQAVLYDPGSNRLWTNGEFVSLAASVKTPSSVVLQQPAAAGDRVLVADDDGLDSVGLADHAVSRVAGDVRGTPAAPVDVDGCDWAVWSGGTALSLCGSGDRATRQTLASSSASGRVDLLVRGSHVVANDSQNGNTWALQQGGRLIDNWSDFIDDTKSTTTTQRQEDVPPRLDPDQKPPTAVDDAFGIRAGRANTLPVLLNDSDPNGDALAITGVTAISPEFGRLDVVDSAQKLQITTRATATGQVRFQYTISDGFGNDARANVTVTVHPANENGAPRQVRPTRTSVASGGTASVNVLADWVDPDSDPFYLQSASTAGPDKVDFSQNGAVQFHDGASQGSLKTAALVVSDGSDQGAGSLSVTVGAPGSVPIIAESFAVAGYTKQQIPVAPLPNARGGTGALRLDGVTAAAGDDSLRVQPNYAAGTFDVTAATAGTHHLQYSITDGTRTATATIRLDVKNPPSANLPPITQPTTAFLYLQDAKSVDVLANDSDPAGGVLSLVSVGKIPAESGILAGVVQQGSLRVTLTRSLSGPVTFTYLVTNGKAQSTGTVTVVQTPEPSRLQPPQAGADTATVRVGQVVDIPVLANDSQPNDKPLQLAPTLVRNVPTGDGLLFTAQSRLRYLAPSKPGKYTAEYKITQSDGQYATAEVVITVKGDDAANNRPPAPQSVTARVTAGGSVTIPIPLSGIDPDGDAVSLVGQSTAPRLGAVSKVATDSLTYTAASYSSGTDTFQYAVVDALGAVGTGTIRIGVSPSSGVVSSPIAQDDLIRTRPGTRLAVHVLDNDTDPAQGTLAVTGVEATSKSVTPRFTSDTVNLTAPKAAGSYGVLYTAKDARGGTASAWLYLDVAAKAPLAAPVASDIVLSSQDVANRSSVDVRPLESVSFTEGTSKDLSLKVVRGYGAGATLAGGVLTVPVKTTSQIVPFVVTRKDDPRSSSIAFVWIPGSREGKPEIRSDAPALSVVSGSRLTIDLADQVIGVQGHQVRIAASSSVSATYSDGTNLVANETTLQYTSQSGYFGPASITFTAISAGTPAGPANQATITLPITVTPKGDEPPVLNGADLTLEAGAQTTVDLQALTDYPYPDRRGELRYSAVSGTPGAVTASVSGTTLTLRSVDGVSVGTTARVVVSVKDSKTAGKSGIVSVSIVRSTKPIVQPIPDAVTIRRGATATVSVLANDQATNPFPGHPLRVVSVGSGRTPAGVTVTASADKSLVSVSVAKSAATGTVTIPYSVTDVTNDPTRFASSTISVTIQDVPDAPPSAPAIVAKDTDSSSVVLSIPHAFPNFAAITGYVVRSTDKTVEALCTNPDSCKVSGLAYGVAYSFTAFATNAVGDGRPSPGSATVIVDGTPNPPQSVTLTATNGDAGGHSMDVRWSPPTSTKGTPVQSYAITFAGPGVSTGRSVAATTTSLSIVDPRIQPGNQYSVSITASNKTNTSAAAGATSTAVGPPTNVAVSAGLTYPGHVAVQVTWTPGSANGGSGLSYSVLRVDANTPTTCTPSSMPGQNVGGATSWRDDNPDLSQSQYAVFASNGLFCARFTSGVADTSLPAAPSGQATLQKQTPGGPEVATDILVGPLSDTTSNIDHYQYSLVPHDSQASNWTTIASGGGYITGPGANMTAYGTAWDVHARACRFSGDDSCGPDTTIGSDLTPVAAVAPTPPP